MNKMAFTIPLLVVVLLGLNMKKGFSNTKLERPGYTLLKNLALFRYENMLPWLLPGH